MARQKASDHRHALLTEEAWISLVTPVTFKSLTISSGKLFDRYRKRSRSQPRVDTRSHGYNVGLRLLPQLHISLSLPSSLIFILWFGAPAIAASNRRRGQTVECIASGWMFVASVSNDISLQCVFSSPSQVAEYSIGISGPKVTEIKSIIVGCGWKNDGTTRDVRSTPQFHLLFLQLQPTTFWGACYKYL